MATAAEIGASASNYTGNAALGGGSFGFVNLDMKPIEDLARYTMLYNKAEYDQRQKDAEKAANEIADLTSYDLTTGIPKDAEILGKKYDELTAYVRDNPGALDYRNKEEWLKYKKMRSDLNNDIKGAQTRNAMWALRQQSIQAQTDPDVRRLMQEELDAEIAATDIRTPIKHEAQYQDYGIKLPAPEELSFDVTKQAPNGVVTRDFKVFNVSKANLNSDMFALGLDTTIDPNTPEGKRQALARKNNIWLRGAEAINSTINAQDAQGNYLYKTKHTDEQGNVTWTLDESKLAKLPRGVISLAKQTNEYLKNFREDVNNGYYTDNINGGKLSFGPGALDPNDYREINIEDGISAEELGLIAQFAQWKGDTYGTKYQATDDALQASQQAEQARHNRASEALGWAGDANEKERIKIAKAAGVNPGQVQSSGVAFDEIAATFDIPMAGGGKISNGWVIGKDNKPYTGKINLHRSMIPTSVLDALKLTNADMRFLENEIESTVAVVKDGQIMSINDVKGRPITRQAMINAQKKFDTERKDQPAMNWGRNYNNIMGTTPQPTQTGAQPTTTSSGLPIIK